MKIYENQTLKRVVVKVNVEVIVSGAGSAVAVKYYEIINVTSTS